MRLFLFSLGSGHATEPTTTSYVAAPSLLRGINIYDFQIFSFNLKAYSQVDVYSFFFFKNFVKNFKHL